MFEDPNEHSHALVLEICPPSSGVVVVELPASPAVVVVLLSPVLKMGLKGYDARFRDFVLQATDPNPAVGMGQGYTHHG